jgi:hypothetical protein
LEECTGEVLEIKRGSRCFRLLKTGDSYEICAGERFFYKKEEIIRINNYVNNKYLKV